MNILFICKTLPHEKVIGGPIIIYNRVRLLSERHRISLICFVSGEERSFTDSVSRFCLDFQAVPMPERRGISARTWDFFFSPVPIYFLDSYSREMYVKLGEMVRRQPYDVIVSEYSMVAQYLYRNPDLEGMKRVMSVHECYYLARRKALRVQGFTRAGLSALVNMKGLKKFEFDMYASADRVLVLTPQGKRELLEIRPDLDISVVPHGVDPDRFRTPGEHHGEQAVMFLGNYPHDPNRDAVIYFSKEIWPLVKDRVPEALFYVVGKDPTPDLRDLAREHSSIVVTGTVEDVRPYFERSRAFVNPVRMGGGFRGKMLEAMAMGLPIVSTSLGAEGVEAENGRDMIIVDDAADFAQAVVRLLQDPSLRRRLGENARRLVEDRFSWEKGVEELERVLTDVVG